MCSSPISTLFDVLFKYMCVLVFVFPFVLAILRRSLYLWRDIKLNHNFYTDLESRLDLLPIPLQNSFRVQVAWDVNLRQQVKARRDESEKDDFCNRFSVTDIQGDSDELRRAQGRKCTSCSLGSQLT